MFVLVKEMFIRMGQYALCNSKELAGFITVYKVKREFKLGKMFYLMEIETTYSAYLGIFLASLPTPA